MTTRRDLLKGGLFLLAVGGVGLKLPAPIRQLQRGHPLPLGGAVCGLQLSAKRGEGRPVILEVCNAPDATPRLRFAFSDRAAFWYVAVPGAELSLGRRELLYLRTDPGVELEGHVVLIHQGKPFRVPFRNGRMEMLAAIPLEA